MHMKNIWEEHYYEKIAVDDCSNIAADIERM